MKNSPMKLISDGLVGNNPVFVQFLGMCSALAITTSITNAVGMGIAVTAVLICSNVLISLLRKLIVPQIRIAAFIVIISGFVTAVELLIKAYLPSLDKSLGLFIPLIVVNCMILARAEAFASKNGVVASAIDGLAMGLGYTVSIIATAAVRELLGTGKLLAAADGSGGFTVLGDWYTPANIFILPPGAFLTLAFLCALFQKLRTMSARKKEKANTKAEDTKTSDNSDDSTAGGEALFAAEMAADMTADEVSVSEEPMSADEELPDAEEIPTAEEVPAEVEVDRAEEEIPEELSEDVTANEDIPAEPELAESVIPDDESPVFYFGSDEAPADENDAEPAFDFEGDAESAADESENADVPDGFVPETDDPLLAAILDSGFDEDDGETKGENA